MRGQGAESKMTVVWERRLLARWASMMGGVDALDEKKGKKTRRLGPRRRQAVWPDDALILLFSALDSGFPSFCSGVVAAMRWRALTLPWPDLFGRQPASSGIVSADDKASFWLSEVVVGGTSGQLDVCRPPPPP